MDPVAQTLAIHDLLTRFFQAFDDKAWPALRECLCDEVFADYSSFREVPAAMIPADTYVEQRRIALQPLDMQHNFLNLRVELHPAAAAATARCNYIVHRFQPSPDADDRHFHSCGHYVFAFVNVAGQWRISRITQSLLRNQGDREIHGATRT